MNANPDGAEIGVRLKAAILRARVARGSKPSLDVAGRIGGADVAIGINNGKPTLSVSKTF